MQTEFDSIIEGADFEKIYSERRNKVFSFMAEHNIGAAVFSDFEEKRDPAVRYLCGHPGRRTITFFSSSMVRLRRSAPEEIPVSAMMSSTPFGVP